MAERLQDEDLQEHPDCIHHLHIQVTQVLKTFFTTTPVSSVMILGNNQSVFANMRAYLQQQIPTVTWTPRRVRRAFSTMAQDDPEE